MGNKVDILTREEVKDLFDNMDDIRAKVILLLGVGCGMKLSDILNLKVRDCKRPIYRVYSQRRTRDYYFADTFIKRFLDRVNERRDDDEYVLCSNRSERLSRFQAHRLIKNSVAKIYIPKNISVQSFRKTYAQWFYNQYKDVKQIKKQLGFTNTSDFLKYIEIDPSTYKTKRHTKPELKVVPAFLEYLDDWYY